MGGSGGEAFSRDAEVGKVEVEMLAFTLWEIYRTQSISVGRF